MSATIRWYVDEQVLYQKIKGSLQMDETRHISEELSKYFGESDSPKIHILVDLDEMDPDPNSTRLLSTTLMPLFLQRNLGWIVIFAADLEFSRLLNTVITRTLQARLKVVDTADDALAFLQKTDASLPTLPPMYSQ